MLCSKPPSKTEKAKAAVADYVNTAAEKAAEMREEAADRASHRASYVADQSADARAAAAHRAAELRDRAAAASEKAGERASHLMERAAPAVDVAKERAAAAREAAAHGYDAAAPRVETARNTLVEDVLPKVAGAIATVAAGALSAKEQAAETAHRAPEAFAVLKGEATAKPKKRSNIIVKPSRSTTRISKRC